MTPSELKRQHNINHPSNHFFDRETMKYWGDTMKNYGVRDAGMIKTCTSVVDCWELYRKKPTCHGGLTSAYFTKDDFRCVLSETPVGILKLLN